MAASRGVKKYKNTYSSAVQSLTARKHALVEQFAGLDEQRAKLQLEEEVDAQARCRVSRSPPGHDLHVSV